VNSSGFVPDNSYVEVAIRLFSYFDILLLLAQLPSIANSTLEVHIHLKLVFRFAKYVTW